MLDDDIVGVKTDGDFACFTRPDLKVERMTYPCMTPSAARGVLDSILWKPEFQWYVRRILILKPVKFFSVKRNEIKAKQGDKPLIIEDERTQRNSIILRDVSYIIEASIYQKTFDSKNPPQKYVEMFRRRVKHGQCFRRPFLGTREFSAEFCEPNTKDAPIKETIPIGSMLFDLVYDENGKPSPLYFYDVAIIDGKLDLANYKHENELLMQSSHLQSQVDNEFSAMIYKFNKQEEIGAEK
jgi:CRISPR-associated protein Cas5d